ncbi:MAG TPA: hypothetical protein DEB09_03535 [Candidatus Magasanikbacteria bacterium]|nr:hypothetical protein [Candidatus Magasanikbacteria bacterium]
MSDEILITSYEDQDLDGTACMFAYAEFLNGQGKKIYPAISGIIQKEAQFVLDKFSIEGFVNLEEKLKDQKIILVDTSELEGLSSLIKPDQVIEVIDHRKSHDVGKFPQAKAQIELVGSCATLIAEKFYNNQVNISKESVVLLYSAIVSNTVNFQAKVTTDRDIKMAEWLKNKIKLPQDYVHQMFINKSQFDKPLEQVILGDMAFYVFDNKKISIAQLEMVEVDKFFANNLQELKNVLQKIKIDEKNDFIFLSCIDIEKGFNKFLVIDKDTEKIVRDILNIDFVDSVAKREGILMRKEILPLVKEYFGKI